MHTIVSRKVKYFSKENKFVSNYLIHYVERHNILQPFHSLSTSLNIAPVSVITMGF